MLTMDSSFAENVESNIRVMEVMKLMRRIRWMINVTRCDVILTRIMKKLT